MFSVNPSGSKPKSPTRDPSRVAGCSRKGKALLFAIITVVELGEEAACFTPKAPLGTGTNAWAPAQHMASTAKDFMFVVVWVDTAVVY